MRVPASLFRAAVKPLVACLGRNLAGLEPSTTAPSVRGSVRLANELTATTPRRDHPVFQGLSRNAVLLLLEILLYVHTEQRMRGRLLVVQYRLRFGMPYQPRCHLVCISMETSSPPQTLNPKRRYNPNARAFMRSTVSRTDLPAVSASPITCCSTSVPIPHP